MKIIAGNFGSNLTASVGAGGITIGSGSFVGRTIKPEEIVSVTALTEENKATIGGAFGGAAVGALLAGPIGAIAGAVLGGKRQLTTLAVQLRSGWAMLCVAEPAEYQALLALTFRRRRMEPDDPTDDFLDGLTHADYRCPECGGAVTVDPTAGPLFSCPHCGGTFSI